MSRRQRMAPLNTAPRSRSLAEIRSRYTRALEERVAFLETALSEASSGQPLDEQPPAKRPALSAQNNALGEVVELLSMGNFEAPAYIGSSSGLNLALNLGEMVQATVWNKAIPRTEHPFSGRRESTASMGGPYSPGNSGMHPITMQEVVAHSAEPPSDDLGRNILAAYFSQIHPRYPLVDPAEVWALHEDRMALATTPISSLTKYQRFGIFKLYLIYAIGAMLLQLTEKHITSPPEVSLMRRAKSVPGCIVLYTRYVCETMADRNPELLYDGAAAYIRGPGVPDDTEYRGDDAPRNLSPAITLEFWHLVHDRPGYED